MEGGMVDHVARIRHGQPLYVAQVLEFTPYIYPPLYFYMSAAASTLCGIGFFCLRFVSFLSSLLSFALIFLLVWKKTGNSLAALAATGLFAATFEIIQRFWFDVAPRRFVVLVLLPGVHLCPLVQGFDSVPSCGRGASVACVPDQTDSPCLGLPDGDLVFLPQPLARCGFSCRDPRFPGHFHDRLQYGEPWLVWLLRFLLAQETCVGKHPDSAFLDARPSQGVRQLPALLLCSIW